MGDFYASGRGVLKGYSEAEKWFRLAAAQNDLDAKWNIGNIYQRGAGGIPKHFAEAEKWYLSAANQGHIRSQYTLAAAYRQGDGVDRDVHEAARSEPGRCSCTVYAWRDVRKWRGCHY